MIGLASASAGVGLFAFFSDTASSVNNLFEAGDLALSAGGLESAGAFFGGSNVKPGDSKSGSILLQNAGSLFGSDFDLDIALDQATSDPNLASFLEITSLTYNDAAITLTDSNLNGWVDMDDFDVSNAGARDLVDPAAGGEWFNITIQFHTSAGNDLQGDNANFAFTFFLAQVGETDLAADVPVTP